MYFKGQKSGVVRVFLVTLIAYSTLNLILKLQQKILKSL